ncbi:hypothetical protein ACLOJK_040964 [Asimina triloba]
MDVVVKNDIRRGQKGFDFLVSCRLAPHLGDVRDGLSQINGIVEGERRRSVKFAGGWGQSGTQDVRNTSGWGQSGMRDVRGASGRGRRTSGMQVVGDSRGRRSSAFS